MPSKRSTPKRVSKALAKYVRAENAKKNPRIVRKSVMTIRNAAAVKIKHLPNGKTVVSVSRKVKK